MGLLVAWRPRCWITAFSLIFSTGFWLDAHALSEQDFLGDMPVVLSATRLVQPKHEAPAAITVFDRAMIEASPALDITDLLRLVPGFQVGSWSGSEKSITSHGMADQLGRRMQVLVDGRSVYDPVFGGALWQSLPLSLADVERIEVVRGPNAAAYGANAFQGAINIITRSPAASRGGRAQITAGAYGRRQADLAEDWASGAHRLQLRAGLHDDDGFIQRHDSIESTRFNARYQYQPTPRDELDFQIGLRDSTVDKGFPDDFEQPLRDNELRHTYQQLNWQRLLPDGSDLSLQLYHSYQSSEDAYDYGALPGTFLDFSFTNHRYDAELQWRVSPAPGTRLVLGGGWRMDQGEARYALDTDADTEVRQLRLFMHGEHRLSERWLLQAGAMAEDFEGLGRYLSPRVTLNHTFLPRQSLRLGVARGYRIPALYEQYANFGAYEIADGSEYIIVETSPDQVKPESITAYEIGLVGELKPWRTSYDIKLFRHVLDDLIDTVRVDPVGYPFSLWEFRNSGQMDLRGIELQLDMKPTPRTDLHLAWSVTDPDGDRLKSVRDGVVVNASLNERVPRHTFGALLRQRLSGGWSGSLGWFYVDPMIWGGEGDDQRAISRFDLKLGRSMRLLGSDVKLELLVQNLFNRGYYDFYLPKDTRTGNLFDRHIYGQVEVRH